MTAQRAARRTSREQHDAPVIWRRILAADKKLVPGQLYQVLRNPNSPSLSKLDVVLSKAKSAHNGKLEDKISSERRANNQAHSSVEFVQKVAILLGLRK